MKQVSLSPYAELSWLEDVNAIEVKWLQLYVSLDKFKEIAETALQMISINKSSIWLINQYDSEGVFSKKILEFITNELVANAVENYGIKLVLTVMPKEVGLSSLSAKRWTGQVREMDAFIMADFATLEDCKQWILKNT